MTEVLRSAKPYKNGRRGGLPCVKTDRSRRRSAGSTLTDRTEGGPAPEESGLDAAGYRNGRRGGLPYAKTDRSRRRSAGSTLTDRTEVGPAPNESGLDAAGYRNGRRGGLPYAKTDRSRRRSAGSTLTDRTEVGPAPNDSGLDAASYRNDRRGGLTAKTDRSRRRSAGSTLTDRTEGGPAPIRTLGPVVEAAVYSVSMRISLQLAPLARSAPGLAIDFYVSPSGSDGNPGTLAAPFATLTGARDKIRLLKKARKAGPRAE